MLVGGLAGLLGYGWLIGLLVCWLSGFVLHCRFAVGDVLAC